MDNLLIRNILRYRKIRSFQNLYFFRTYYSCYLIKLNKSFVTIHRQSLNRFNEHAITSMKKLLFQFEDRKIIYIICSFKIDIAFVFCTISAIFSCKFAFFLFEPFSENQQKLFCYCLLFALHVFFFFLSLFFFLFFLFVKPEA